MVIPPAIAINRNNIIPNIGTVTDANGYDAKNPVTNITAINILSLSSLVLT